MIKNIKNIAIVVIGLISCSNLFAQQDPEYTQYMYNTMVINPGYAGSKGYGSLTLLGRSQWVGVNGAPETQTLSFHTPLGLSNLGLGFNLIKDELGPSEEIYADANISYTLRTSEVGNLAFGLRLGGRMLNIDWSKGNFQNPDVVFNQNINNRFLATVGAGFYYYTDKWYLGLSVPNFLRTDHYDDLVESVAIERLHYFLILGRVFDLSEDVKFKPAALAKIVSGAPLSIDISANFLFNERFTAGLSYRWDDSISALINIQVNDRLQIGYAYDLTTSNFRNYNSGTHEVMLTYDLLKAPKLKSPRFF
ncbi:PorP/SprF family type IX secretion system membrane protein [Pseudotenacibaculum haliotis]|uniref:Type IX secretion system membrane protein PorP/SprF n=1 Tax=Pseudotenacibaculum haliotis TaxID=1862138 RepID=A0ABW5LXM0_9FLAO